MADPFPYHREIRFHGYYPAQNAYSPVANVARDGKNAWVAGQQMVADSGATSAGSCGAASPLMIGGGAVVGMSPGPGVVLSFLSTYWFAGNGIPLQNGVGIGLASTGKLMLIVGGQTYEAGLAAPTAKPTATDPGAGVPSGIMQGSYAVAYAKYRQTTGAVSSRSPISDPVALNKHKLRVGGLPTTFTDGTTHLILYGTRRNFAGLGLVFRITNVAIIPVGSATVDIEYQDGDLGDVAELTNDPAPACTHCASLGSLMCAITAGGMVYPSKIGQPEAFDTQLAVRLAGGEAPTGVITQGVEGGVFVGTLTNISILILSGAPDAPVLPRGVFAQTGVAHGNAMCWAFDTLWLMTTRGTPARSHGGDEPDMSFAIPVAAEMKARGFTGSNTFVIYDEFNHSVLFCAGSVCFAYNVPQGQWSAPIDLPGTVTGVVDSRVGVGGTLYKLNSGGSPSGQVFLTSPFDGADGRIITLEGVRGVSPTSCTFDVLADLGGSVGGKLPWTFTAPHGGTDKVLKTNRKARSFAGKWSTSTAGAAPNAFFLEGTVEPGNH